MLQTLRGKQKYQITNVGVDTLCGSSMIDFVSRGPLIQYGFECRSSCSKILSYRLSRTFT